MSIVFTGNELQSMELSRADKKITDFKRVSEGLRVMEDEKKTEISKAIPVILKNEPDEWIEDSKGAYEGLDGKKYYWKDSEQSFIFNWDGVNSKEDIAVFDKNDEPLPFWIEYLDLDNKRASVWIYNDWVRDGTIQAKIAYELNNQ